MFACSILLSCCDVLTHVFGHRFHVLPHEFVTHKWHAANKWAGQQRQDVKQKMLDAFNKFKVVRFCARFVILQLKFACASVDRRLMREITLFRMSNTTSRQKAASEPSKMKSGRLIADIKRSLVD